ncbi:hypothetical protein L1987_79583 [Smallanthus sonchifolius]|uniref:Uncharacterized protein n=1 Tax=Smallanthus sonchifolius TaxID=185202 RepID=A0ACB8YLS9_9ASTR|nr:hypothetical protein L1987_79583 [Smallanthus sonchifolius]
MLSNEDLSIDDVILPKESNEVLCQENIDKKRGTETSSYHNLNGIHCWEEDDVDSIQLQPTDWKDINHEINKKDPKSLSSRCYGIEPVPREENQYIAYVAYPLDLFEEGSVTNMFTSIVVIDRQKNHGMHFRVLAKELRMSGGDHIHSGTVVGKLKGERGITLGFVDLLRDDFIEKDRSSGIYFTQDWVSLPVRWRNFREPLGKCTWGVIANRVALEACVQARNEGHELATEGNEIIREATKWSPELAAAFEVWKEIKFEFHAMHTLDTDKDKDKKR